MRLNIVYIFSLFFLSCSDTSEENSESFNSKVDLNILFEEMDRKENKINDLKVEVDNEIKIDSIHGIGFLDSLMENSDLSFVEQTNLLIVSSEILYELEAYELALSQTHKVDSLWENHHKKIKTYQAKYYLALGDSTAPKDLLIQSSEKQVENLWLLGNYYELIGDTNSAIDTYNELYEMGNYIFDYAKMRIDSLEAGTAISLIQLDFNRISN